MPHTPTHGGRVGAKCVSLLKLKFYHNFCNISRSMFFFMVLTSAKTFCGSAKTPQHTLTHTHTYVHVCVCVCERPNSAVSILVARRKLIGRPYITAESTFVQSHLCLEFSVRAHTHTHAGNALRRPHY